MTALREFKKVKDGMIHIEIPKDFNCDEVEIIVMPKSNPALKIDPYFTKRKEYITKSIQDIENGKIKVYTNEEFEDEMDKFEEELICKYGN